MNHRPKIFIHVAISVLLASALLAPSAFAGKQSVFKEKKGEATITGDQPAASHHIFNFGSHGEFACSKAHFDAVQTEVSAPALALNPSYSGCNAGAYGITISMNGCQFVLRPMRTVEGKTLSEAVSIDCPAGKSMEVIWKISGVTKCTMSIPGGQELGVAITNEGAGKGRSLVADLVMSGINYTAKTGMGAARCEETPSSSSGSYVGSVTLSATNEGVEEGIWAA